MYNTKIKCSYNLKDIFTEEDKVNSYEEDIIRNMIYRQEFLDIFELDDYDNEDVMICMEELLKKIAHNQFLKKCLLKLSARYFMDDMVYGLIILFSFDYMYCAHECISQFIETGQISKESETKLNELIFTTLE